MLREIEVLSPAGSIACARAAITAGADAIYIGGTRFGARAFADNPDEMELLELIDYVHLHGKKVYMTINTLFKEQEIQKELYSYLLPYYKQGLDAVIVQDVGVLVFVRKNFPDLPIHVSTQMSVSGAQSAKELETLGVTRVVPARELGISEINEIAKETNLEIECFVHGALCYCYSGQCLFSSILGGRSGNRGQCAQPCRLPYSIDGTQRNYLSLKDICTLEMIPEMIQAGITSFKIEGRMKKPEYVAAVTFMYRKYANQYLNHPEENYQVDPKDVEILLDIYNRGNFTTGYYRQQNGKNMVSLDRSNHAGVPALKYAKSKKGKIGFLALTKLNAGDVIELKNRKDTLVLEEDAQKGEMVNLPLEAVKLAKEGMVLNRTRNQKLIDEIQKGLKEHPKKETITGCIVMNPEQEMSLTIQYGDIRIRTLGAKTQLAKNQPLDSDRVKKQLNKMGDTSFVFQNLEVQIHGDLFVPMQELNALRRDAIRELEEQILSVYRRALPPKDSQEMKENGLENNEIETKRREGRGFSVIVEEESQLQEVLNWPEVQRVYADIVIWKEAGTNPDYKQAVEALKKAGKEVYLILPFIFRKNARDYFEQYKNQILIKELDGVMARNLESVSYLRKIGYQKEIITDANLYRFNSYADEFWRKENTAGGVYPFELNARELEKRNGESLELPVYGYIPMMVTAQCVNQTKNGCDKCAKKITITDRYKKEFVVKNYCDYCYNVIYNSLPMMIFDLQQELSRIPASFYQLRFTIESVEEMRTVRDMVAKQEIAEGTAAFTRGHFKRGVK